MGKVWNLKVLYILITTTFVVVSAWPLESLHHNGMFAHKYSNICAQQQRGVNICCVPSIHISQFISATIWSREPGAVGQGPRPGRSCTWNIHCRIKRLGMRGQNHQSSEKIFNSGRRGLSEKLYTWPAEHEARLVVWALVGKWKMTSPIKLERMDCQTEGKQVFWGHCDSDTVCWKWCDIISCSLQSSPPTSLPDTHSSSTLAAFHAHTDNDSSNTLDWILILEQWVEYSFLRVDLGNSGMSGRVRRSCGISEIELSNPHSLPIYNSDITIHNIISIKCLSWHYAYGYISTDREWRGSEVWDVN